MKKKFCIFCKINYGIKRKAKYIAQQSEDKGKTITEVPICEGHAEGWNDGGDWKAKVTLLK